MVWMTDQSGLDVASHAVVISGAFALDPSMLHLKEILFVGRFLSLSRARISLKVSSITSRNAENALGPRRAGNVFSFILPYASLYSSRNGRGISQLRILSRIRCV